jgi:hypothetical protein
MEPVRPKVEVPGDREDKVMAATGWVRGYEKDLVVWQFGFLPGTVQAQAYGVSVEKCTWVLADSKGTVMESATGKVGDLPKIFERVLRGRNHPHHK